MFISVVTVSDRCAKGICEDVSGKVICDYFAYNATVHSYSVVPDEVNEISNELIRICDELKSDIVFTTGGTGFAPRDVTPEATKAVLQKETPGISEAIRMQSLAFTPKAMLSRACSGIRGQTLIINLPGSPKAVREALDIISPVLSHAVETLSGVPQSCGGNYNAQK